MVLKSGFYYLETVEYGQEITLYRQEKSHSIALSSLFTPQQSPYSSNDSW